MYLGLNDALNQISWNIITWIINPLDVNTIGQIISDRLAMDSIRAVDNHKSHSQKLEQEREPPSSAHLIRHIDVIK
jgi:hypothetical protein